MFACLHAPGNLPLLVECAKHFSPLIEETSPDTAVFDIKGLGLIFGSPEQIADTIERRVGIPANLAIASNPDAAVHAARGFRGVTILAPGREAEVLAPLPTFLLGGSPDLARALDIWGVRSFGQLAALPPLGVAARLGDEGVHMQRLARGQGGRQLRLLTSPLFFRGEQELEHTVALLDPLLFLFSRMLKELCEQLHFYGLRTNEIHLRLELDRGPAHIVRLRLPVPMLDSKVLLKLLQLELSDRPPQAAVKKIQMELMPVEPRTAQSGLFVPATPEPQRLEITLTRIRGLVGKENVGAPELLDTHRPDSFWMKSLKTTTGGAPPLHTKLAFRRFRPPHPAQVWCVEGRPARITSSREQGRVIACAGPWHTSGDWWTAGSWDQQKWDVEIERAGVFCLYRQKQAYWFVAGSYD